MGVNKSHGLNSITDGSSNTLLVAEIRIGLSEIDRRGTWAMGSTAASHLAKHGFGGDDNGPNACNDNSDDFTECAQLTRALGLETLRGECMTCWSSCNNHQQTARSVHPGGVFAVFCDGSVHFISDDINTGGALWRLLQCVGSSERQPGRPASDRCLLTHVHEFFIEQEFVDATQGDVARRGVPLLRSPRWLRFQALPEASRQSGPKRSPS